ncbi:LLM class flavin-dependent oxidoreductase [Paraburkholderia lycopersici]|uniref:FMN-dependent oxidoreductase, nitrilotriacetate monooxygenase family n=1 Tax=Paraburkholderia lycopersici TaxID=416944 RepID=A0A1G6QD34_9BURK|nr:LLM class flavin-dependent oxidoreductase [Paraburkholderia lycopersici]SDC89606.1 FMN-dependent oxidoreductase, nitrilotriacetate monooxygenase family [Paraburkholderia lycopersici]
MKPGLILNAVVLGVGMHPAAWRFRRDSAFSSLGLPFYAELGRLAESACLHALFLADTLAVNEENFERPNLGAMDPLVALASIAGATKHLGLVGTASTTYNDPFSLARRVSTLDHLSGGRAGWNVVTTFVPDVAANFGNAPLPDADARYARAEEFVDVVRALWGSWTPQALVGDKVRGVYVDAAHVRAIDHHGAHFDVRGPLTLPPSRQGAPVVFQAGSSDAGRSLAARTADVVFTAQNTLAGAQAFRADVRQRAQTFGRDPASVKVLPGLLPILGGTEEEARRRKRTLDELGGDAELKKLALRVGVPVEALQLDRPLPFDLIRSNPSFRGAEGFRNAAVELGLRENLTVREILYRNGGGHLQVVGTPEQVAQTIEDWFARHACDGFNLMIDVLPDGLGDFAAQVVPLLQKRGIFRSAPEGDTLRSNLGLQGE